MSEHDGQSFAVREARADDTERMSAAHAAATVALGWAAYDERQVRAWARGRYEYPVSEESAVGGDGVRLVVAVRERAERPENGPDADYDEVLGFGELHAEAGDYLSGVAGRSASGCTSERRSDAVEGEVRAVYVHPAFARQGVGSALYADLERWARERGVDSLGLWASLNAVGFYERQGFERVAEHDHEFAGDVAATVAEMRKSL